MTTENPYAAPAAAVIAAAPEVPKVPMEILKKIKNAWGAALFSAGITLVFTLVAMSGTKMLNFSAWQLIDVILILGLAFGIYKKSRTCAVLLLIYFIGAKLLMFAESGAISSIPMALVFGYFYWQGVSGTFAYHKFIKS
jgi:hypothetical protein